MADHKHDTSMATGVHRPWVGENTATQAPVRTAGREALRPFAARPATGKPNARHSAITKSLSNFPSYKTWAEKTKATWQEDEE
jgi:hypothetical protein